MRFLYPYVLCFLGTTEGLKSVAVWKMYYGCAKDRLGVGLALWWFYGYPSGWWPLGSIYCRCVGQVWVSFRAMRTYHVCELNYIKHYQTTLCVWMGTGRSRYCRWRKREIEGLTVGRQEGRNTQSDRQLHKWTVYLFRPLFADQVARLNMFL